MFPPLHPGWPLWIWRPCATMHMGGDAAEMNPVLFSHLQLSCLRLSLLTALLAKEHAGGPAAEVASRHLAHILATLRAPVAAATTTLAADSATTSADSAPPSARVGTEPSLPSPAVGSSSSPTIRADDGIKDVEMTACGGSTALVGGSTPAPAPVQLV